MCGVCLNDESAVGKFSSEHLRAWLVIEKISEVMCQGILRLFVLTKRMERESWMKRSMCMNAVGRISRCKLKSTCDVVLQNDFRVKGVRRTTALYHMTRRDATG